MRILLVEDNRDIRKLDMGFLKTAPMRYLLLVTGAWLLVFLLTRGVLLITHLDEVSGRAA